MASGRRKRFHRPPPKIDGVRNEINVTPLVDVCLVLLIIFLVVLDKLARGKDVPLPKTMHHTEKRDNGDDLIVSVSKDGAKAQIWWDRDQLADIAAFKQRLNDELRRKQRPMYFKADADLRYGDVYPVLMAIHDAGANSLQLATQEQKEAQ